MSLPYSVFDSLQDSVIVIDSSVGVHYGNQAAAILLEVSSKRLKNSKPLSDFIELKCDLLKSQLPVDEPTQVTEIEFQTSGGQQGWVQVSAQIDPRTAEAPEAERRWILFLRDVSLEKTLHDKYKAELDQKENVIQDLRAARVQLEDYSKNLEKMVEQRTAELRQANTLLSAILDSLGQGILVFEESGRVLPYFSKISEEFFQSPIKDASVQKLLEHGKLDVATINSWLEIAFQEMIPFEDAKSLGPNRFEKRQDREIELHYNPMRNAEGRLNAVVMVATDKTDEIAAKREAEFERSLARRMVQIAKHQSQFRSFAVDSIHIFERSLEHLDLSTEEQALQLDRESLARDLHTFKGGAGTFALNELVTGAHDAEQFLTDMKQTLQNCKSLRAQIEKVSIGFMTFLEANEDIIGGPLEKGVTRVAVARSQALTWLERLAPIKEAAAVSEEIEDLVIREEIGSYFEYLSDALLDLAHRLGKEIKGLQLLNKSIRIDGNVYRELFSNLIHIFRNAIDHGLEIPEERRMMGKDPAGLIQVKFELLGSGDGRNLRIVISDDGGGIDPLKIKARMQKLGYPTQEMQKPDQELIQVIFDDRFTSRDSISEVSGRGVGLSAVRAIVEKMQGHLLVNTKIGQGTEFVIEVPYVMSEKGFVSPQAA